MANPSSYYGWTFPTPTVHTTTWFSGFDSLINQIDRSVGSLATLVPPKVFFTEWKPTATLTITSSTYVVVSMAPTGPSQGYFVVPVDSCGVCFTLKTSYSATGDPTLMSGYAITRFRVVVNPGSISLFDGMWKRQMAPPGTEWTYSREGFAPFNTGTYSYEVQAGYGPSNLTTGFTYTGSRSWLNVLIAVHRSLVSSGFSEDDITDVLGAGESAGEF